MPTKQAKPNAVSLIAENAAHAFKEHVIEQRSLHRDERGLYATWRCGRPDSGTYAFLVTVYPGVLVVTGDVGDLIVERTTNMIAWCRGSVGSIDYFAEKVPHAIPTKKGAAWNPNFLWCRECVKWFVERVDNDGNVVPE